MSHSSDEEEGFAGDLFGAEEEIETIEVAPTFEVYARTSLPLEIKIKLVGSHPLWAHHLWNASKVFASLFDNTPRLVKNKSILELGAGGALPSLVAALNGASTVVVTDYPDKELIENIEYNVKHTIQQQQQQQQQQQHNVIVEGYIWGTPTDKLRAHLPKGQSTFDVLILSDLVFNHSQHHAMLKTCRELLTPNTGRVYVFYTHHRPHLAHRDLEFFEIAQRPVQDNVDPEDRDRLGYGFKVDHFMTQKMHVMFKEDPGDEQVRATVHGWQMWIEE
ncbi:nicotinamide n-methyltransferase [Rhizopus stolonifer]|uniref:Nicotinamide n-methyltransferase n=1 Tax=Rhizopus stolonifer TaxID=4846 RepID=A0A367KCB5_RHIST|nr:nicotinamide n-methyltransferase [Rhizopus stolonifer]